MMHVMRVMGGAFFSKAGLPVVAIVFFYCRVARYLYIYIYIYKLLHCCQMSIYAILDVQVLEMF